MTPTEKLQRLIEIAKANGLENSNFGILKETIHHVGDNFITVQFPVSMETIIFDHSFIQALCKAKYGDTLGGRAFLQEKAISTSYDLQAYQYVLFQLAISDNRLDYLWEIFGGAPEF